MTGGSITGAYLNGQIGEIIAYDTSLSNANMNSVGQYLASKWALTWSDIMTQYALVQADVIVEGPGALPDVWNDGTRDWDLRPMTDPELAALGWLPLVETPRPVDTADATHDYTVEVVAGQPTVVWRARSKTAEEKAADESSANTATMRTESGEAVDKLVLVVENLNAITDLTNADINANPAAIIKDVAREVKTVARQANREARMTSGRTDDTYTGPPDTEVV